MIYWKENCDTINMNRYNEVAAGIKLMANNFSIRLN